MKRFSLLTIARLNIWMTCILYFWCCPQVFATMATSTMKENNAAPYHFSSQIFFLTQLFLQDCIDIIKRCEHWWVLSVYPFFRTEGYSSFWRGNFANILLSLTTPILTLTFKEKIKVMFKRHPNDSQLIKFAQNSISGACAGAMSSLFTYSLDYSRTRWVADYEKHSTKKTSFRNKSLRLQREGETYETGNVRVLLYFANL